MHRTRHGVNTDGTATIHCDCPIYDGPFQIGKSGLPCDNAPQVWSAAYNAIAPPPDPCDMVGNGSCIPGRAARPVRLPAVRQRDGAAARQWRRLRRGVSRVQHLREQRRQLGYTCDATLCTSSTNTLVLDACLGLQNCDLSEIFKAEGAADCSCCGSQLCNCDATAATEHKVFELDAAQRAKGQTPQCDINGTLCGTPP